MICTLILIWTTVSQDVVEDYELCGLVFANQKWKTEAKYTSTYIAYALLYIR